MGLSQRMHIDAILQADGVGGGSMSGGELGEDLRWGPTPSTPLDRAGPIAAAFAPRPTISHVEARVTRERVSALRDTPPQGGRCDASAPPDACVTSSDAPEDACSRLAPGDTFGRLLSAALPDSPDQAPHRQLAPYFRAVFGEAALSTMIGHWKRAARQQESAHTQPRPQREKARAEALEEAKALIAAGMLENGDDAHGGATPPAVDDYIWAKLVATRAFKIKLRAGRATRWCRCLTSSTTSRRTNMSFPLR